MRSIGIPRIAPSTQFASGQRGVALLTILLMVVMATILASSLLARQQRMLKQSELLLRQDQALQYALAGEGFLGDVLLADQKINNKSDSLSESWAQPMPVYPVEDGAVTGKLLDQSGKFNLNDLYHDGQPDPVALEYFKRLLDQAGLSAELANAVLDWQDPDKETTGNTGAEDSVYQGKRPPYRAANRPFTQVDELRLVQGFDDNAFNALSPFVVALPQYSPINVNTAPAQVLAALAPSLTSAAVTAWVKARDAKNQPIEAVSELWSQAPFDQVAANDSARIKPMLDVKSQFFEAQIQVMLSGRQRHLRSSLYRSDAGVVCYQRTLLPVRSGATS